MKFLISIILSIVMVSPALAKDLQVFDKNGRYQGIIKNGGIYDKDGHYQGIIREKEEKK